MVTQNLATQAILSVMGGKKSFCKFLSANDTGKTGGHQAGIYIAKPAVPIIFQPSIRVCITMRTLSASADGLWVQARSSKRSTYSCRQDSRAADTLSALTK